MNSLNFQFLEPYDSQLVRYAADAERYAENDPESAIFKVRKLTELLACLTANYLAVDVDCSAMQLDVLKALQRERAIPRDIARIFHEIRQVGNSASHEHGELSSATAILYLRKVHEIAKWFHSEFQKATPVKPQAFVDPREAKSQVSAELRMLKESNSRKLSDSLFLALLWTMNTTTYGGV